jgi:hypothetical protein
MAEFDLIIIGAGELIAQAMALILPDFRIVSF